MANETNEISIFEVWKEYEKIAMHFNDLLMKIRTQGLAAVATLSVLIGAVSQTSDGGMNWTLLSIGFFVLSCVWAGIWILDYFYYNRLLVGAVVALKEIEKQSKTHQTITELKLSTRVEDAVADRLELEDKIAIGPARKAFYALVLAALMGVGGFSLFKAINSDEEPVVTQTTKNASMGIHDLSWNAYYKDTGSSLTRNQIFALTHSDLKPDMQLLCNVFRFMDTAGIPPMRNENS